MSPSSEKESTTGRKDIVFFCGVERGSGKSFLVDVEKRDAATLIPGLHPVSNCVLFCYKCCDACIYTCDAYNAGVERGSGVERGDAATFIPIIQDYMEYVIVFCYKCCDAWYIYL